MEWCPHDSSTLATTAADNQLVVWDLALERDPEEEMAMALETNAAVPEDIPPQMMFVHAGQVDMKVRRMAGDVMVECTRRRNRRCTGIRKYQE